MSTSSVEVDFLIVTALREETEAVKPLLEDGKPIAHGTLGHITRERSALRYDVAVTDIAGMGTNQAQAKVRQALSDLNPKRVILTGIAAGFGETGVRPGDVLVPHDVVPYELAKIKERSPVESQRFWGRLFAWLGRRTGRGAVTYEHRGRPIPVSEPLWWTANDLGGEATPQWAEAIREPRPDGTDAKPLVHSSSLSVLGSGDKVVASALAEARRWLLEEFPGHALGLEMEAFGVVTACRMGDIPFLVVKAAQDDGTARKDAAAEKDRWRQYAAKAAAAFTIAVVRHFELSSRELLSVHMKEAIQMARTFERNAPTPRFAYRVSRAESYALLEDGVYHLSSQDPSILVPSAAFPRFALHGGGGTGKTRIMRSLIAPAIDAELCPVLVDLKAYVVEKGPGRHAEDPDALVGDILHAGSVPRRTSGELERLARESRLVVLLDGLNEISREARTVMIDYFQRLDREGCCYMVVTDRMWALQSPERFTHASVDRLELSLVKRLFDAKFGTGTFGRLDQRRQRIYQRPFFLSLVLGKEDKVPQAHLWSAIFEQFFVTQLRMSVPDLDATAQATLAAFQTDGSLDLAKLKSALPGDTYERLVEAEVLGRNDSGFEHHLWRDYLTSRQLAKTAENWRNGVLDLVTTFSSSPECLSLTVEQLPGTADKDRFLKKVFDWNYVAAADCLADPRPDDPEARQLSLGIRVSILAFIADKRFDAVERTRERASRILGRNRSDVAQSFNAAVTRPDLVAEVTAYAESEDWFQRWKALFARGSGETLSDEDVAAIASNDSVIGWTAANSARRAQLNETQQQIVRTIYHEGLTPTGVGSVRWRAVHVLGAHPSDANVDLLTQALEGDPYHWVQYGAARALMEIAAGSESALRTRVIEGLTQSVQRDRHRTRWMQRQVLQEIIETAFIRSPRPGWKDAVRPVLRLVTQQEPDISARQALETRLSDFEQYDDQSETTSK